MPRNLRPYSTARRAIRKHRKGRLVKVLNPVRASLANRTYTFKRCYALDQFTVDDTSVKHKAYAFKLNSLPNYTEFTGLFDMYRIKSVFIKGFFTRANRDVSAGALDVTGDPIMPLTYDVVDYDDATALSNLTDYEQYQTFKVNQFNGNMVIKRKIFPRIATGVNSSSGGNVLAGNERNKWVDMAAPDVQYFGWKLGVDGTLEGTSAALTWGRVVLYAWVTFQCRMVR